MQLNKQELEVLKKCRQYLSQKELQVLETMIYRLTAKEEKQTFELYSQFIDAYYQFRIARGGKPRITAAQGKAMKEIIKYLQSLPKADGSEEKALSGWQFILGHWQLLPEFLQSQVSLTQINKYIEEIVDKLTHARTNPSIRTNAKRSQKQAYLRGNQGSR